MNRAVLTRFGGTTFTRSITPSPVQAAQVRHEFDAWLRRLDVEVTARSEVLLALSEAVSNAVEHGSNGRFDRPVVVTGTLRDDVVAVVVRDHGHWREPMPHNGRGRGMGIMRTVMHEVTTECTDHGTVVRMQHRL